MIKLFAIRWGIHPLLVFVMLASAMTGYFAELAVLFAIVTVHELGHVFAARAYGWRIREIRLLPFGGVMETEEAGTVSAAEEAVVAAAGPLQNVWMGAAAWLLGRYAGFDADWADYIVKANATIAIFNLLPILPLDGGKLASAWLSSRLPYEAALRWSSWISLVFSALMTASACMPAFGGIQLNLLLVGIFLFVSNWSFLRSIPYVFIRFLVHRELASERMKAAAETALPIVVAPARPVSDVIRLLRRGCYHLVYVISEGGRVVGVLPEERVIGFYLSDGRPGRAVSELIG